MNTQTHVLLAVTVLVAARPLLANASGVSGVPARAPHAAPSGAAVDRPDTADTVGQGRGRWVLSAAIIGALLPDATLFAMVGIAKWQGVPDAVIFGQWYYRPFWQSLAAISNSVPLYLAVLALAWGLWRRLPASARIAGAFAAAALLHVLTDLPLHHDDGRPHFWPLSDWVFASPVSYWDPAHHGRTWSLIELALAAMLIAVCWRAHRHPAWRIALILAGASYAFMAYYWAAAFG